MGSLITIFSDVPRIYFTVTRGGESIKLGLYENNWLHKNDNEI